MTDRMKFVLVAVVGGIAIIALTVFFVTRPAPSDEGEGGGGGAAAASSTSATSAAEASDGGETAGTDVGPGDATEEDRAQSSAKATEVAQAWVNHTVDAGTWRAQMQPLIYPFVWDDYNLPDPQRIRPTTVTGPPVVSEEITGSTGAYTVPTDAGDLHIALLKDDDGTWYATEIDKTL